MTKSCFSTIVFIPFILCSCSKTENIIFVQESMMGVDASVSTQGTQKLQFGFGRDTFAIVPKKNESGDTMSALSYSYYSYQFPSEFEFNNFIATGAAAKLLKVECERQENSKENKDSKTNDCEQLRNLIQTENRY